MTDRIRHWLLCAEVFVALVVTRLGPVRVHWPLETRRPAPSDAAMRQAVRLASLTDRLARTLFDEPACLWRAHALMRLLLRRSVGATLHYGVRKDPDASIRYHAWVEMEGITLIGDLPDLHRYRPLV